MSKKEPEKLDVADRKIITTPLGDLPVESILEAKSNDNIRVDSPAAKLDAPQLKIQEDSSTLRTALPTPLNYKEIKEKIRLPAPVLETFLCWSIPLIAAAVIAILRLTLSGNFQQLEGDVSHLAFASVLVIWPCLTVIWSESLTKALDQITGTHRSDWGYGRRYFSLFPQFIYGVILPGPASLVLHLLKVFGGNDLEIGLAVNFLVYICSLIHFIFYIRFQNKLSQELSAGLELLTQKTHSNLPRLLKSSWLFSSLVIFPSLAIFPLVVTFIGLLARFSTVGGPIIFLLISFLLWQPIFYRTLAKHVSKELSILDKRSH